MSGNAQEEQIESVSRSVENFTADFHKSIASTTADENFVGSALSAHSILSLAACGAEGTTKSEMRRTLRLPGEEQLVLREFQSLIDVLNAIQDVALKIANKIYGSNSIEIKEKFKEITSIYFRSECETLDFSKNAESANVINKWCIEQTNGKISDIVSKDALNSETKMLLVNAVYFKGNWKHKFYESGTGNAPFHISKTTTIEVPMMTLRQKFFYENLEEFNAEIVGLPYQNEDFCMLIIIPNEIDGLQDLEKNLEKINIAPDLRNQHHSDICLSLPKFKLETSLDLTSHLRKLGMIEMFSDEANFNGIANECLKIDGVIQKAFIEVNEEGTEAAAVTVACFKSAKSKPRIHKLVVDRPFIYKIVYKDFTLFSGHIVNPLKS